MKKRFLCIMLAILMVLTGIHAPAVVNAEETAAEETVSNAHYLDINKTNIPDAALREWIINNLDVSGSASSGYYMTQAQAESVTQLGLRGLGITNAKGIEKFTKLERLVLWDNSLTSLDVTKNTELTYLDLDNNQLKKLDLSKNTKLQTLYINNNQIAYLRLVNNTAMTSSLASQSVTGKKGCQYGSEYLFDLSALMPKSMLKFVTLSNSSYSLDTSTGVVTMNSPASSFSYSFNTGNSNTGSLYVTIYVDEYVSISKPAISTQPASVTVSTGEKATFTVKATGGQLKYQWQYRKSSSDSWTNVSTNGTSKTYTLTTAARHNGYQYRCVVKNLAGSVKTKVVTLTVTNKPIITKQPVNTDAAVGETVQLKVTATGKELKYQWQYRKSSSDSWANVSAASGKTATYTLTTAARHNGYQYRCRVKNSYGTVYSKVITLTVGKPIIKIQPANTTVAKGAIATFTVTAAGSNLKFQWYYRTSSSASWKKVSVSNATTYQLYSSALQIPVTKSVHGYQYRCVITNKYGKATSKTVTLLVKNGPVIKTQPASQTVYAGDTVKFTVKATGTSLTYKWQYRKSSSGSWTDVSTGGNKATYSLTTAERHNGYQYRCIINNAYGKVVTKVVTLKVKAATTAYRALLIGESGFGDGTRNQCDADHMAAMLASIKGPNGRNYTTTTMYNLDAEEVRAGIESTFANTKDADVSLFFIATHGNSDGDGELLMDDYGLLDFETLANWLNQYIKGKVIVIIESCGSGSAIYEGNAAAAQAADELLVSKAIEAFTKVDEAEMENAGVGAMRQSKFYVLAASAHHQMSWGHEGGSGSGNYFTDWLIEGIGDSGHMPADTNNDNVVTLHELYTYISQFDTVTFQGSYTQQVQVYPTNSSYKLFKR